jgi:hypothetical protein
MEKIIHFNTFYGSDAEEKKLNILDALEAVFGVSTDAKQIFEDPENEEDGFDLYLKYENLDFVDYDFLKSIAVENEIYIMVYNLEMQTMFGYWYDEDDEWVDNEITEEIIAPIEKVFE